MSDYDKLDRIMELHSKIEELQKENARFKDLLWRVYLKNTCCEPCQEAKKVAISALEGGK